MSFGFGGSDGYLSREQSEHLYDWVCRTLPHSIHEVGAFIAREFGIDYKSRSGLINLLHRIGLEYRKPEVMGRKLDIQAQAAFISDYEQLQNALDAGDVSYFPMRFIQLMPPVRWGVGLPRARSLPWLRQPNASVSTCMAVLI